MDDMNEFIKKNAHPLKLASFLIAGVGFFVNAKLREQETKTAIDKAVSEQIEGAVDLHMADVRHLQRDHWNNKN